MKNNEIALVALTCGLSAIAIFWLLLYGPTLTQ